MDTWNQEIINILNKIRLNSITLSNKHRNIALSYQSFSKYFDIPVIIFSTFSSSVSGITYMKSEEDKSQINLFISMIITILTSVKLYLNISSNLNSEISLSTDFYILSVDIYKNLNLNVNNRPNGNDYLNECYSNYIKLCEKSNLTNKMKKDELLKIEDDDDDNSIYTINSNLSTPRNIIITQNNEF